MNKDFNQYLSTFQTPFNKRVGQLVKLALDQNELIRILLERAPELRTKDVSSVVQEFAERTRVLAYGDADNKGLVS